MKLLLAWLLLCSLAQATTITFESQQNEWLLNPGIESSATIRHGYLQVQTSGAFSTSVSLARSPWGAFSLSSVDLAELPSISADKIRFTGIDLFNRKTVAEFSLDRLPGFQTFTMPTGFEAVSIVLIRGMGGTRTEPEL